MDFHFKTFSLERILHYLYQLFIIVVGLIVQFYLRKEQLFAFFLEWYYFTIFQCLYCIFVLSLCTTLLIVYLLIWNEQELTKFLLFFHMDQSHHQFQSEFQCLSNCILYTSLYNWFLHKYAFVIMICCASCSH